MNGSHHRRYLLPLAAVVALAACGRDLPTMQPAGGISTQEASAREFARGLALALAAPEIRASVRDAMRASLWDEHKVPLREFAQTPAGLEMLSAAARARGVSLQTVQAELAALPSLDFYMPLRAHRRTWTADANLVVVAGWEGEGDVPGFTPDGRVLAISRRLTDAMPALFFIQPAEWKGKRIRPQANTPGLVVEDADDGSGSEVFIWRWSRGDSVVIDFAEPDAQRKLAELSAEITATFDRATPTNMESCDPTYQVCDCDPTVFYCEQPPPPPPAGPRDTTNVGRFVHYMKDHGFSGEAGEFRFDAHLRPAPTVLVDGYGSIYRSGLYPTVIYWAFQPQILMFRRIVQFSQDWMDVTITEEDRGEPFGFNPDDYCGTKRLTWESNGVNLIHENTNPSGADNHCNGGDYGKSYALEVTYHWTPTNSY